MTLGTPDLQITTSWVKKFSEIHLHVNILMICNQPLSHYSNSSGQSQPTLHSSHQVSNNTIGPGGIGPGSPDFMAHDLTTELLTMPAVKTKHKD